MLLIYQKIRHVFRDAQVQKHIPAIIFNYFVYQYCFAYRNQWNKSNKNFQTFMFTQNECQHHYFFDLF